LKSQGFQPSIIGRYPVVLHRELSGAGQIVFQPQVIGRKWQSEWYMDLSICTISRVTLAGGFAYILYVALPGAAPAFKLKGLHPEGTCSHWQSVIRISHGDACLLCEERFSVLFKPFTHAGRSVFGGQLLVLSF
jgi:hypothetical protein